MNRELLFYITAILLCAGILSCNKKEAIATCNYEVVPLPKSITPAKEAPFILSTSTHIGYPEGNEKPETNGGFSFRIYPRNDRHRNRSNSRYGFFQ